MGLAEWLGYLDSEIDPAIQAEIMVESGRAEARLAILMILLVLVFGVIYGFTSTPFSAVAWFALFTVVPLLVDSAVRRNAAKTLDGMGPRPPMGVR